ncbi:MAG: ABC transporter substrate-binding protein [Chloroflexi bacterium]|nr:ABC transporter substrate-binding protein [Chloroflexota bacterium]
MKNLITAISVLSLAIFLLGTIACGGGDATPAITPDPISEPTPSLTSNPTPSTTPSPTQVATVPPEPSGDIVITIGNLTDLTGVSSSAMETINLGLEDIVEYYNNQNLIPGIELKVIHYDGQYNSELDLNGYEWLKEKGADVIFTAIPTVPVALKPYLEKDDIVLFTVVPSKEEVVDGGYIFAPGSPLGEDLGYTLLDWIAENDPVFPQDRPAKIGGAFWDETYGIAILDGAEQYANDHPDQFEWTGTHLTPYTFTWEEQVDLLIDCDYVIPPIPMNRFVQQYREAGGAAKFIGTHAHDAFLGSVRSADLWDEMDKMLFIRASEMWVEEDSTIVTLMLDLLKENHPGRVAEVIQSGCGYLTGYNYCVMLELIREAVLLVGEHNFDSQAIFDAAKTFSIKLDDVERETLSDDSRLSINYLVMYELNAAEKKLFRVGPKWNPVVHVPE